MKKILIVDDDHDLCEVIKIILGKAGYESSAVSRFEPFNEKNAPDLILLDIALPNQDGRKICKQLKRSRATRHIPIIMFSASRDTAKAAIEAGADDSIEKPFQINQLIEKIKNLPKIPHNGEKIPQSI